MSRNISALIAALSTAVFIPIAHATALHYGDTLTGGGGLVQLPDPTSLIYSWPDVFTCPAFSGTLTTDVYQADASNPLGGETFVYTLHNNATSLQPIRRINLYAYLGP